MATPSEAVTFAHRKGAYGCFPVPPKKDHLIYGYLTHNIGYGPEDDCKRKDDGPVRRLRTARAVSRAGRGRSGREGERLDGGAVNELLVGLRSREVRHMDPTDKIVH
jgi:hypothetical protein